MCHSEGVEVTRSRLEGGGKQQSNSSEVATYIHTGEGTDTCAHIQISVSNALVCECGRVRVHVDRRMQIRVSNV